jgi:hypothetical protein
VSTTPSIKVVVTNSRGRIEKKLPAHSLASLHQLNRYIVVVVILL